MLDLGPGRPGGSPFFVNSPLEAASGSPRQGPCLERPVPPASLIILTLASLGRFPCDVIFSAAPLECSASSFFAFVSSLVQSFRHSPSGLWRFLVLRRELLPVSLPPGSLPVVLAPGRITAVPPWALSVLPRLWLHPLLIL
jgi:hypothetical protein